MDALAKAKELIDLIQKYNNQDLYQRIVELRDEIFRIKEENMQIREELNLLKMNEDISDELYKEGNAYFRKHKDNKKSGPYCLVCWDRDRKLVNMFEYEYGVVVCEYCSQKKR